MTATPLQNDQFRLAARPVGLPKPGDWQTVNEAVRPIAHGEIVVKTLYLSLDPAMRGWMNEGKSYIRPVAIGEVMRAGGVGVVVESKSPKFAIGDHVSGGIGVQTYWVGAADDKTANFYKIDPRMAPLTTWLNTLGMPGMTAYFGLLDVGQPKAGETVVVSGAAGAVGQTVGQVAKHLGCRVVGIAGGQDKCDYVVKQLGFDACIDYKNGDVREGLKQHCPNGVDVYFDNVGGTLSEVVFRRLALGARVPVCGQISQYNLVEPELAPRNLGFLIVFRARLEGFLVSDYTHRFDEGLRRLGGWLADGTLRYREDVTEGLENAPGAFIGMLNGANRGKTLVKIADPSG